MYRFLRRLRYKIIEEDKFRKYTLYAIGEIILVVIGILIALQLNNWNEIRNANNQLQDYRLKLISKLENDLVLLKKLDSVNLAKRKGILNYINYFDSDSDRVDVYKFYNKSDSHKLNFNVFTKISYTLDELTITTSNIALFSDEEKLAIARLKSIHEAFKYYERHSIQDVMDYWQKSEHTRDLLFDRDLIKKQHASVIGWQYSLESEQHRLFNNQLVKFIQLYDYQNNVVYQTIRKSTQELLDILKKNSF